MTERPRSKDGTRDSDRTLGKEGAPSGQGRAGGRLARDLGTRDEQKRVKDRPAGVTRKRKSDEKEAGNA